MSPLAECSSLNNVAVVGLGRMGLALARSLKAGGAQVSGWARSEATRMAASNCCVPAASLADAVKDVQLIILCLPDYATSRSVLEDIPSLEDRTIVQLSSGGPIDARHMADYVTLRGSAYLDGAIATFPRRIGDATTTIFYSGDRNAWEKNERSFALMAGNSIYLGDNVAAAASADLGWLAIYYGISVGLLPALA